MASSGSIWAVAMFTEVREVDPDAPQPRIPDIVSLLQMTTGVNGLAEREDGVHDLLLDRSFEANEVLMEPHRFMAAPLFCSPRGPARGRVGPQ